MYHFTGAPDLRKNEVRYSTKKLQSPPDKKHPKTALKAYIGMDFKCHVLSQAGVYAIGQLGKGLKLTTPRSLPAVILYKDKMAQIIVLATVDPSQMDIYIWSGLI